MTNIEAFVEFKDNTTKTFTYWDIMPDYPNQIVVFKTDNSEMVIPLCNVKSIEIFKG